MRELEVAKSRGAGGAYREKWPQEPERRRTGCYFVSPSKNGENSPNGDELSEFFKRTLIVAAVVVTPLLIWYLLDVVLMAMGAIILAMLLRLVAPPLMRWIACPEPIALAIAGLLILAVIAGTIFLFGTQLLAQFRDVMQRMSSADSAIEQKLQSFGFGRYLL